MKIKIKPSILNGTIEIPPSKSYSHRAVIAAALAESGKKSTIDNLKFSVDITTTTDIMENWGAKIKRFESALEIIGNDGKVVPKDKYVQCNESGSTIRFLIPIGITDENELIFDGKGKLVDRPLDSYYRIFDKQGILYKNENGKLPLTVNGKLKAGNYEIDGNISSQFITGLLYALPLLDGDSKLTINKNLESKGYIDLTLEILKLAGIQIVNNNYKSFDIKGNQIYKPFDYTVEGDYSQVAFWIVAGIISANKDNEIKCLHVNKNSLQGDREIIEIVTRMGANLKIFDDYVLVKPSKTKGTIIDISQCPDIGPILTVLGALSEGETRIINGERLRIKESDRITSIKTELNKLGANVVEEGDSLIIQGVEGFTGGVTVNAWNDHRIAMSLAIASTRCEKEIILEEAESVRKSYPHFWDDFVKMGGEIEVIEK
ncbi:3-phosphoshikimate 1-carboxyvinyltransferase [Leptotrichia buccalis]|uniref:3-phosphoshikimate 1-carboxyvinyltransferase n=1 Tax=Leptotrichia buccalis (strain ATCC 14201 / DSM 1135 / JCM 12969 / NCTC 10249 / C-1013-b) TaxID=523794 RepID=C7NCK6_LEPBD|nr:3-phosphoshikimate 1-carboxyvinyltransferase [Leptotrichia buccalis]ACV39852.1 3-phosphoshikimate 1-carboxyvinyltransferase [Leptotrichia buccalis C-1013-b]